MCFIRKLFIVVSLFSTAVRAECPQDHALQVAADQAFLLTGVPQTYLWMESDTNSSLNILIKGMLKHTGVFWTSEISISKEDCAIVEDWKRSNRISLIQTKY